MNQQFRDRILTVFDDFTRKGVTKSVLGNQRPESLAFDDLIHGSQVVVQPAGGRSDLRKLLVPFIAFFLLPVAGRSETTQVSPQPVSPANGHFRYEGRFDFSDPAEPAIIWQASRIRLDFEGATLALLFAGTKGQCFFNAEVDGSNTVVEVREGDAGSRVVISGLGNGRHQLVLFKRSEANAGSTHFRGVETAAGMHTWAPEPPAYKFKMEFLGDSITVGACNEDGSTDQWENRRTHNCALSYATFTANAFAADYRNTAVSGMGVAVGWVSVKAGEIWDRFYPDPAAARIDVTTWKPDVILINLGENDDSFSRAHGQLFPTNYTDNYVALVQAIRQVYPAAEIVLLRGGMYGGARSGTLRAAWEAAVARLEGKDPKISHFVFTHWTSTHPRVPDDHAMADELIAWLKQQDFMRPYR